ncbi:MAG: dUTP diphosphatase [Clostridia bacterium]|nr:dUTP diphosphatase [Clostridia bacterium]
MKEFKVRFKRLSDLSKIPVYSSPSAAGADLYAATDRPIEINAGETVMVKTGLAVEIPDGYVGLIFARSGLASKRGVAPANKVGVIDSDYRGEIIVALHNHSNESQTVDAGERIAQMAFLPYMAATFEEAEQLSDTERGIGGFGSTGRK